MQRPVTVVVGLGQIVGEAVVLRFLKENHDLVVVDADGEQLANLESAVGEKAVFHHGPTHTLLGLRNGLAATLEAHHFVDNVICIPPLPEPDTLLRLEMGDFEKVLMQTVRGAVQALRVFSPELINERTDPENAAARLRQTGTFTFVLSLGAAMSQPGWFSESVTQHAIVGIVKAAAVELAHEGIRVNAVIALRPRAEGREPWLADRTPMARAALAEEIAETTAFLANPASAIITGETITLDGGRRWLSGLMSSDEDEGV